MLKERLITAVIGLPLVVGLMVWGPKWLLILVFLLVVGLAAYECANLILPRFTEIFSGRVSSSDHYRIEERWFVSLAVILAIALFLGSSAGPYHGARGMVVVGLLVVVSLGLFSARSFEVSVGRASGLLFCVVYSALPMLAVWDLYLMGDGARYVMFLLAVVWSGDTGAYFGGLWFGKRPLSPQVSPKKTWEGAIFGLLASVAGGAAINAMYIVSSAGLADWVVVVVASVAGGALGQVGDLVESLLKRFAGVKDSGSLLPGHGGFLDRVDGLFFAAPVIWFLMYSFGT